MTTYFVLAGIIAFGVLAIAAGTVYNDLTGR